MELPVQLSSLQNTDSRRAFFSPRARFSDVIRDLLKTKNADSPERNSLIQRARSIVGAIQQFRYYSIGRHCREEIFFRAVILSFFSITSLINAIYIILARVTGEGQAEKTIQSIDKTGDAIGKSGRIIIAA